MHCHELTLTLWCAMLNGTNTQIHMYVLYPNYCTETLFIARALARERERERERDGWLIYDSGGGAYAISKLHAYLFVSPSMLMLPCMRCSCGTFRCCAIRICIFFSVYRTWWKVIKKNAFRNICFIQERIEMKRIECFVIFFSVYTRCTSRERVGTQKYIRIFVSFFFEMISVVLDLLHFIKYMFVYVTMCLCVTSCSSWKIQSRFFLLFFFDSRFLSSSTDFLLSSL